MENKKSHVNEKTKILIINGKFYFIKIESNTTKTTFTYNDVDDEGEEKMMIVWRR